MGPNVLHDASTGVFLLTKNDNPKSTLSAVDHGDSVVSLWNMATSPNEQKKGYGAELMEGVMSFYEEHGTGRFFLTATDAGFPLYQKMGFSIHALPKIWTYYP